MTRSTLFTIVFLGLLAGIGYLWYGYYSGSGKEAVSGQTEFSQTLNSVRRFRNLELDTSLFEDRFFLALESPAPLLQPDVVPGRTDPFAAFR